MLYELLESRQLLSTAPLTGSGGQSFAALAPGGAIGDGQTSIVYDAFTGELAIDAPGIDLTSIHIESESGIFSQARAVNLDGSFDENTDHVIFKATFGSSFGSLSFGNVAVPHLTEAFVASDLTAVGSLSGGADMGPVDLLYICEGERHELTNGDLSGQDLRGWCFSGADLTNANLQGTDLSGAQFENTTLTGANFQDAVIAGVNLSGTVQHGFTKEQLYSTASYRNRELVDVIFDGNDLTGWDFSEQDLTASSFRASKLADASLRGALIDRTNLRNTTQGGLTADQIYSTATYDSGDLNRIDFSENGLDGWQFQNKDLTFSRFEASSLAGTSFSGSSLYRADLRRTNLVDASFAGASLNETRFESATATRTDFSGADLSGATFREASVTDANLSRSDIRGTHFINTISVTEQQIRSTRSFRDGTLAGIVFEYQDLTGWDFSNLNLTGADFYGGVLVGTKFSHANLTNAFLANADVAIADFRGATIAAANFGRAKHLTSQQIYSTQSYLDGRLGSVSFEALQLDGWDFSRQDFGPATFDNAELSNIDFSFANLGRAGFSGTRLHNVDFTGARLDGTDFARTHAEHVTFADANLERAELWLSTYVDGDFRNARMNDARLTKDDFTGADLRGAVAFEPVDSVITRNMIWPDSLIRGLDLRRGESLAIRNGMSSITVLDQISLSRNSMLNVFLDGREWHSTLILKDDTERRVRGTLNIMVAPFANPADLVGSSFDLFDWNEVPARLDEFAEIRLPHGTLWNLDRLYDTGEVELSAVLVPGDVNQDFVVDQSDLTSLRESRKYLTREPASWNEGDFDGNGFFDQLDIVALLQADDTRLFP